MSNTATKSLTLRLEMLSDWHIGTGAGIPGSIDAMLARDANGLPCVPGKTIVGIWRDALETLTLGLDNGDANNKVWQRWVDVVFGSQPNVDQIPTDLPRPSILSIEPAHLNENLRGAILATGDKRLKQALTFIKPNTAIDSKSGTAKSESLRFTEMGRIGTVLEAKFKLHFDLLEDASNKEELIEALLVASAALVERVGGNRRRGSGRCELQLDGLISRDGAVAVIRKYKDGPPNAPSFNPQKSGAEAAQRASGHEWEKISYSLRLQTPVAIVTNTLGNVSETLDFIPGTYLLPHITRQLKSISKYVAAGDFQISPATIDVQGERGLPVPKIIHHQKVGGGFDEANTVHNPLRESVEGGEQKKNYREGYINSVDENGVLPFYDTTKKILLMHNTVEDQFQCPTEAVGGVFSRQAIKAEMILRGEIRLKKAIAEELSQQDQKWIEKLNPNIRLGTSKKDDYGLAELTVGALEPDIPSATVNGHELVVYFESDVLLRHGNLRQTNLLADLKSFLEAQLSFALAADEKRSLIQVRRIESWHEGWGFPRPTLTAMAAGSVAVFTFTGTIDQAKLRNLELSGIGERRGEGYGRIRLNPPLLMCKINDWTVPKKIKPQQDGSKEPITRLMHEINSDKKLGEFVSIIERAAWRDELARAVLKLAYDKDQRKIMFGFEIEEKEGRKNSIPSLSQIGGLRSTISRLSEPKDKNVIGWLDHLMSTSNRLEKWDKHKDKAKAKEKLNEIKKQIDDETKVWLILCETNCKAVAFGTRQRN